MIVNYFEFFLSPYLKWKQDVNWGFTESETCDTGKKIVIANSHSFTYTIDLCYTKLESNYHKETSIHMH